MGESRFTVISHPLSENQAGIPQKGTMGLKVKPDMLTESRPDGMASRHIKPVTSR